MSTLPHWPSSTIVCLSCGPSLTQADVDLVRGAARVICVSNAYQLAPWADVLYSADFKWWKWHDGVKTFAGLKYSLEARSREFPDVTVLRRGRTQGLSLEPGVLCTGQTSGYQAINLAAQLGARRIVLLGYDMQRGPKGEEHFFGHHPNQGRSNWSRYLPHFQSLVKPLAAAGIEIVNCTRRTALECFPTRPLEEVFPVASLARVG